MPATNIAFSLNGPTRERAKGRDFETLVGDFAFIISMNCTGALMMNEGVSSILHIFL